MKWGSRSAIAILSALGLLLAPLGCENHAEPPSVRRALRLGPAEFESLPVSFHGAVAPIGDEARPVLVVPESEPVLSLFGLAPQEDGRVRAEIELPEAVRDLPTAAFTLQVQRLPGRATPELLEQISRTILSRQIIEGWSLTRAAGGRATLVYEHGDPVDTHRYSLHLQVLHPGPVTLRSRTFEAPAGATLELAYGLTTVPGAAGFVPVQFRAELDCDGESPRRIVDDTVAGTDASGWRDVATSLPKAGASCQLELAASGPEGEATLGAVWAVPRIFVRPQRSAQTKIRNIVMISLDTLRADHLSGFGYPRVTSPRIDADLIARGTSFRDVTSTYSRTDVSHMSLFTGLYPEARPERGRIQAQVPVPTLAERLRDAGFETAAYTEDGLIAGVFGFWFGFDRFTERAYRHEERAISIFEDGIAYITEHRERPFFLFLHTYKTHAPYYASPPYQDLFGDDSEWDEPGMIPIPKRNRHLVNEYDRTIREADYLVGKLLDAIDALGLAESTLIVLLSDHGESFGEHGTVGHSYSGHQEVMRVPVILRGPGVPQGLAVETPTSLVDVVPSLLDLLDLPPLEATQGISWLPALRGGSLSAVRPIHFSWLASGAVGVRFGAFKYKRSKGSENLFNLTEDPGERRPLGGAPDRPMAEWLLADHVTKSAKIREEFERRTQGVSASATPVSPEMEESLRALGYIE